MGKYIRKDYRRHKRRVRQIRMVSCIVVLAALVIGGGLWAYHTWNRTIETGAQAAGTDGGSPGEEVVLSLTGEDLAENGEKLPEDEKDLSTATKSPADTEADSPKTPGVKVKGIYVTGPMAGNDAFENLLTLVDETELNTMVIDIKNDDGEITYQMEQETVREMGACVRYIRDMEAFMEKLKAHGVYTIARIVCFKDPVLAGHDPKLALKKPDGKAVTDGNGLAWVNPYEEKVWQYLVEVAKAAADIGFDEIQFDYVRFPIGKDADAADYGVDMQEYPKQQAIAGFLSYAVEELHEKDVLVTADVFGTIIGSETDVRQVGQDYVELGRIVDVLSPMVYPSHYGNHVFGLEVPDAKPYETVLAALEGSAKELESVPGERRAGVRPWLQAFTASWVEGHISYGGDQIRQQIQAVYDAGYEEWILWNAANRYTADGLLEAQDQ